VARVPDGHDLLRIRLFKNIADEFCRRYAVPYEDEKIAEHGDVYEA
jgi:hypothetical protein